MKIIILLTIVLLVGCTEGVDTDNLELPQEENTPDDTVIDKSELNQTDDYELMLNDFMNVSSLISNNCSALNGNEKNICYRDKSISEEDASYCSMINITGINNNCLNWVALKSKNITICSNITNKFFRQKCEMKVNVLVLGSGYCEESEIKDWCYRFAGPKENNKDLCMKIEDEQMQESCIKNVKE